MKNGRLGWIIFALTLAVLILPAQARAETKDPLLQKAESLKKNLEKKGYQVLGDLNYSQFVKVNPGVMYCEHKLESCNGFNFGGLYLSARVPTVPGQAPPRAEYVFRLRPNEAVVLVGKTPPPCDYFSYTGFLYYRYEQGWGPLNIHKVFSNLGDTLNSAVMAADGNAFNKNIVMVYTSDGKTNDAVRAAASAAGFPKGSYYTYVLPASLFKTNFMLDETTDQLMILHRNALFRDGTNDGSGYMENPHTVVFRVTPPGTETNPLPTPKHRVRGSGTTEYDYGLAVEQLRRSILLRHSNLNAQELTTTQWLMESALAVQTLTNTLGDSPDTPYLRTQESFKLTDSPDDFVIAYGVNHQKTKKSTYHNVNVYKEWKACGVAAAFDHCYGDCKGFAGSASEYLKDQGVPESDKLYAIKISRNCKGERFCLQAPTGGCGEGAELDEGLFVGFRAYLEPATKTGASYTELLFDRVIHFSPSAPPALSLPSQIVVGRYPDPVAVPFAVSSKVPGDVTWQANIEYVDDQCCALLEPDHGIIRGGAGQAQFNVKGAYHPGLYFVTITAKDQQGRFSTTEVQVNMK